MKTDKTIKVMIVDDHPELRDALRHLLQALPDIDVVAEAPNGQVAIDMVAQHCPHIVLMDIKMPVLDGIKATRTIKQRQPGTTIIALSTYSDEHFVRTMMDAGASGYLPKTVKTNQLEDSIRKAFVNQSAAD